MAGAEAPDGSLRFLFYGGIVVLPVIALYTMGVYWVFRGKVRAVQDALRRRRGEEAVARPSPANCP